MSNRSGVSPSDFYSDVVIPLSEVLESVTVYAEAEVDGDNILRLYPNSTVCGGESPFQVRQYYYNGDCYSLSLPSCMIELGILELVFVFLGKIDIFIHHQGQFLNPNSR